MTVDAASAATSAATSSIANSQNSLADTEQTFLSLLTTQLKNQDPLSPEDPNQFTAQIVEMTGVQQQLLTNNLLKTLVGLNDGGLSGAVSMIGKSVRTQSDTGKLQNGQIAFSYTLPSQAGSLKLEVVDQYGNTIATNLPSDLGAGAKTFTWDGKASDGTQEPDGGTYTLKVTGINLNGSTMDVDSSAAVNGVVTAVANDNGTTTVTVNGVDIPLSSVVGVTAAAS